MYDYQLLKKDYGLRSWKIESFDAILKLRSFKLVLFSITQFHTNSQVRLKPVAVLEKHLRPPICAPVNFDIIMNAIPRITRLQSQAATACCSQLLQ
jgi:hypothetical protein